MQLFRFLTCQLPAGLLALAPLAAPAQTLTNSGVTVTVAAGTTLFVNGSLLTQNGGLLANNGTVQLTGDFGLAAAGTMSGAGLLRFSGTADQTLNTPAGTMLTYLAVDNTGPAGSNRLLVPNDLTINSALTLSAGLVRTAPGAVITMPEGAVLAGEALHRYVQGNLRMLRRAVTGVVDFGNGVVLDGSGQSLGPVSITRTAGLQAAGTSYGTGLGSAAQGIDRIWTIVPTSQPTAPMPVTLTWLADDDNGLTNFSLARTWQQATAGSPWAAVGAPANAATRSFTSSVAVLNRLTVSSVNTPLPVELARFTAERRGADGLLSWATASEKNNAYFAVESSVDGQVFGPLGQVAGHGTSAQPHTYAWTDPNLARYAAEVVYYRLRQVDQDGTATFSPVRSVAVPAAPALALEAFPNPLRANDQLSLRVRTAEAGPATLLVTNALGQVLLRQSFALAPGTAAFALPEAAQWPQGVYLLRLEQGAQRQTVKVVRE